MLLEIKRVEATKARQNYRLYVGSNRLLVAQIWKATYREGRNWALSDSRTHAIRWFGTFRAAAHAAFDKYVIGKA